MRRIILLLSILVFGAFMSKAQNIKGIVKDGDGKVVANASVSLLNAKDSSVVKLAVTGQNGQYEFRNIKGGRYITNVSFVGYKASYSPVFAISGSDINAAPVIITKLSG